MQDVDIEVVNLQEVVTLESASVPNAKLAQNFPHVSYSAHVRQVQDDNHIHYY